MKFALDTDTAQISSCKVDLRQLKLHPGKEAEVTTRLA